MKQEGGEHRGEGELWPGTHTPGKNTKYSESTVGAPHKPTGYIFQPADCQFAPSNGCMATGDCKVMFTVEMLHIHAVSAYIF